MVARDIMVEITFHGGVNEIGGNKILIEDDTKLFFDFGKNYFATLAVCL